MFIVDRTPISSAKRRLFDGSDNVLDTPEKYKRHCNSSSQANYVERAIASQNKTNDLLL